MRKLVSILSCFVFLGLNPDKAWAFVTDQIVVKHYDISVNLRNLSAKTLQATVQIHAIFRAGPCNSITLYLLKLKTTSVKTGSTDLIFQYTDSTLEIILDKTYNIQDTINLTITYGGSPALDPKWGGFYFNGNYAFNIGVGMASVPPGFGRCLFPCSDNFYDRSTYSFHITTDSGFVAVCSGLQDPKTIHPDGSITYHWHLAQAIPSYLASIAVGKYAFVQYNFTGIQGTYPVILAAEPKDTANMRASFIRLNAALQCFESKFGPYLFDRVGFTAVPFNSGAMEHACNISYPIYAIDGTTNYETLFAHELSHHWWGNLVTCQTAADMWLNEGWASYCESLFLECVYGKEAYKNDIKNKLFTSLRWAYVRDGAYLPVSNVPSAQTYGTTVYTKGALMVHSLRTIMGDSLFFKVCKQYLKNYAFKDAGTSHLKAAFRAQSSEYLAGFFESWILTSGEADLVPLDLDTTHNEWVLNIAQMLKHKDAFLYLTPITLSFYLPDGKIIKQDAVFMGGEWEQTFSFEKINGLGKDFICVIDDEHELALATTNYKEWIKTTGVKTYADVLFTATIQQLPDSAFLYVEHHFTKPWQQENNLLKGIRVSNERYWSLKGFWPDGFKATAFFNYDGSTPATKNAGFLDNELITGTEDSLVLLYRPNAQSAFTVETDLTKQTGSSKTDKTGRFWANNLKKGDYVFGYYDVKAGIGSTETEKRLFNIYPNPSDGIVVINFLFEHQSGMLEVFDMSGKLVHNEKVESGKNELRIKTPLWKAGSYVLHFRDEMGKVSSIFIVN